MQNLDGIYMVLGKIVHEIRVCPRAVLAPLATLWSPGGCPEAQTSDEVSTGQNAKVNRLFVGYT